MYIYIFILFILFILGFYELKGLLRNEHNRMLFFFVIIFFWFLSFIRWKTGTDWESYLYFFINNNTIEEFQYYEFETFYTYLNYFVKGITDQYWVLLLIIGSVIYFLTSQTIYRYSPYPFISLLVYLMLRKADIFFVRESIGLAFCFFSIRYIEKKQLYMFIFTVLIAMQFHRSLVVFFPAYFFFHQNWNFKKTLYIIICTSIVVMFYQDIFKSLIFDIAGQLGDVFLNKASNYTENEADYINGSRSSIYMGLLNRLIILSLLMYAYHKTKDCFLKGIINLYIVSIFIFVVVYPISVVLSRVYNSYDMLSILGVAYFFKAVPFRSLSLYYLIFYVYVAARFVEGTLLGEYSSVLVPYQTIFG